MMRGTSMLLPIALGAFACALASPACGARQWEVVISTNATVPQMGDRLQIEVLDEAGNVACADCARELEIAGNDAFLTFGVAPTESAVRVRARLFRYASKVRQTETRIIDVVARLPALSGSDSIMAVELPVPIECFGMAPDLARKITCRRDENGNASMGPEPTLGSSGRLLPAPAAACEKPVPSGMVCIGSGSFLMGDERLDALAFDFPSRPESIQRISRGAALMLDVDEATVGEVRALVQAGKLDAALVARGLLSTGLPDTREDMCTWRGPDVATNDDLPINCVSRELARAVCTAKGRRLPFEHEWEFAAGNGTEETLYSWGDYTIEDQLYEPLVDLGESTPGLCNIANVSNGRAMRGEPTGCARGKPGPHAGGNAKDVTTHGVKNMSGNVAEWVGDELALYDDECWSKPLGAPCRTPSPRLTGARAPYRGGSWGRAAHASLSVARFAEPDGAPSPYIGFRCATAENELP